MIISNALWFWFRFGNSINFEIVSVIIYFAYPFVQNLVSKKLTNDSDKKQIDLSSFAPFLNDYLLVYQDEIVFAGDNIMKLCGNFNIEEFG